jgi:hypothetical protein
MNKKGVVCELRHVAQFARKPRKLCHFLAVAMAACVTPQLWAFADPALGVVAGVARDAASGKPLGGVQIVAHDLGSGAFHSSRTDADGRFEFTDLEPGQYEVAAAKMGFQEASMNVQLDPGRTARVDLPLKVGGDVPRTVARTDDAPLTAREKMLLDRIESLEHRLSQMETLLETATATRPAVKPPLASSEVASAASAAPVAPVSPPAATAPDNIGSVAQASAAAQPPQAQQPPKPAEPFAFADWTWLTGNSRVTDVPFDTPVFTPEVRIDTDYVYDYNHPADHTIGGSSEIFRSGEVQLTQMGVGGDFHWNNVRGRLMTQFGMYAETTPRNDASPALGGWDLDTAYRYISEAYGGYHFDVLHGINVDAGIFMSYVGLFSYYQFDNWAYQPSYVSSNTPWFFNGVRIQVFPTEKLKIEPWFVNGWQSYGKFNKAPGLGVQILYRPNSWLSVLGNQYEGTDALGIPGRHRVHTDDSVQIKYYDNKAHFIDKAAMTMTVDAGCEFGTNSGVSCDGGNIAKPSQYFLGFMSYQRFWFDRDKFGFTIGGGAINNPGRYLVLLPPINGATAISGSPYFTENPGDPFKAWDASATFDYMPRQYITWRFEYNHRSSSVPYFTGPGGISPPGGDNGSPGLIVPGWIPSLTKHENRLTMAILVMF